MNLVFILLAAGNSRRFKKNKLLYSLDGKPMFLHITEQIEQLPSELIKQKIVVTQYPEIKHQLEKRGYITVDNRHSQWGITYSIRLGLEAAKEWDAVCFAVCDQPYITQESLKNLIQGWKDSGKGIGCLSFQGEPGNPVIFSRQYQKELLELEGDRGGKKIVKKHHEDVWCLEVSDPTELWDMDTEPGK